MPITVSVGRAALLHASTTLSCALASVVAIDEARAEHVVVTRAVPAVHFLDDDMLPVSSFPVAGEYPSGVATDGVLIYCSDFAELVRVYDFDGVEQFQFDVEYQAGTGVELVGDELAVTGLTQFFAQAEIHFYDPMTGMYIRTIEGPRGAQYVNGIAFDGEVLWLLEAATLWGVDPADGTLLTSVPNPALACMYLGTGVSASAEGELTVVCTSGDWFVISSDDGALLDSGNNGLDMHGSDAFSPPQCGDGIVDDGEECDEFGLSSQCDIDCTFIACGDGVIAPLAGEECDDGNLEDGDGCSATCTAELPATTDGGGTADVTDADSGGGTTEAGTSNGGESSSDGSTSIAETSGASSGPAADESDSTAAGESGSGGCGCTSAPNGSPHELMPLGVLALLRRRRARVR